jgi:hypothetical protein
MDSENRLHEFCSELLVLSFSLCKSLPNGCTHGLSQTFGPVKWKRNTSLMSISILFDRLIAYTHKFLSSVIRNPAIVLNFSRTCSSYIKMACESCTLNWVFMCHTNVKCKAISFRTSQFKIEKILHTVVISLGRQIYYWQKITILKFQTFTEEKLNRIGAGPECFPQKLFRCLT